MADTVLTDDTVLTPGTGLRVEPDADALEFGAGVRELLADLAGSDALRAAWDSDSGRIPGLWARLAELGVPGATVPEEYGGLGLDLRAAVPLLMESGAAALPEPLVETLVGATLLSRAGGAAAATWLPKLADGSATVGLGLGPGALVSAAPWADLLLLRDDGGRVHAVEPAAVRITEQSSVDRGVRLATVDWQASDATALDLDADAAGAGFDAAAVAVAAQLLGLAGRMLDLSVAYALQREQFGKVIGSFQAVKHQLADTYVANAFARPVVMRAAWSVATGRPTRARDASHAKHAASHAALGAARTALQVHAGIGYTYEHDLHMFMKRAWSLTSLWGDVAWHRDRVARAVLEEAS